MQLGRYSFQTVFIDDAILPGFKGAAFRSVFGPALKKVVCAVQHPECSDCLLFRRCLYPFVFEGATHKDRHSPPSARPRRPLSAAVRPPGQILTIIEPGGYDPAREARERLALPPHPSVIEPPENSQTRFRPRDAFDFSLLLFGKANESFPYFIQTFEQMGQMGIGQPVEGRRGRFSLRSVHAGDRVLYAGEGQPIVDESATVDLKKRLTADLAAAPSSVPVTLALRLHTPLKLKSAPPGEVSLPFPILIGEALQRIASLCHAFGNGEPAFDYRGLTEKAAAVETVHAALTVFDLGPHAHYRDKEMLAGAMLGEVTYADVPAEFIPLIRFAEQVHLGEATSYGLGRIELILPA